MPAWTASIQVRKDASEDIQVNLGSGPPCRNDDLKEDSLKLTQRAWRTAKHPETVEVARMTKMLVFVFG
jgi:hypothetical protein